MNSRVMFVIVPFVCLVVFGCGDTPRSHVSGKVTFKGVPVAHGQINFIPTKGPVGSAKIQDGAFDTHSGEGAGVGTCTVLIQGFDGKENPDQPLGDVLFFHEESIDLPASATVKDFVVPENAPKSPPPGKKMIVP